MSNKSGKGPDKIGWFTAMSIVVANMIGTGVFTSLGFQLFDIQSGFSILMLWLVGGVFALAGALSYAELGGVMPRSGGEFTFLSKIYHPAVGFTSGWISATVGFAAPIALAAMALGKYFSKVFPATDEMVIALVVVIAISFVHSQNIKFGSIFQNVFTVMKIVLILVIIGAGFMIADPQPLSFSPTEEDSTLIFSAPFAISLVYVMYSYSGWNASTYVAGEIDKPGKNLPKSLFFGTLIVTILYILLNFVFLYTTPIPEMTGEIEVGLIAANRIFGAEGGKVMGFLISMALISSISSMVWAGPRVTQTMGEDMYFFRLLAKKTESKIPFRAILLQMAIAIGLIVTSTFEAVMKYTIFTLVLSSLMTVIGVFVHRFRFPAAHRPYKTWGYPFSPIIFICISVWMLIYMLLNDTVESLVGIGTIASGVIVYYLTRNSGHKGEVDNQVPDEDSSN